MNQQNTSKLQRFFNWGIFIVILGLIIWGLVAAGNKAPGQATNPSSPIALNKPISSADWTIGSSSAPVTIVEYADFQCPACQTYAPLITQLLAAEGGKVYFAYRYFPLPQHQNAVSSARAAQAAGLQGKFWEMHDKLFANYAEWQDNSDPTSIYLGYATAIGISTTTFYKDYSSTAVADVVSNGYQESVANDLSYTPTFFVNGTRIVNPQGYDAFKKVIDDAATVAVSAKASTTSSK